MRPIIFVKYYDKGSTEFSGHQISDTLRARGFESETLYAHELRHVRDSILVFIKTSKIHHLLAARRRNNLIVLDVHDTVCFKRWIKNRFLYDGIIFKNTEQRLHFGSRRALNEVIPHQADPKYRPNEANDRLRVGYFGVERSMRLWKQIPDVHFFDGDWFDQAVRFNCHLSIRETGREFLYKPGTKVTTAAACHAILITTRDRSAVELLGEDYPYYTEPDIGSVLATIEYARSTFGKDEWARGLGIMARIRKETTLDRIIDRYLDFLDRLETWRGGGVNLSTAKSPHS